MIGREAGLRRAATITTTMGAASVGGVLVVALAAHAADVAKATAGNSPSNSNSGGTETTERFDDGTNSDDGRFPVHNNPSWPQLFGGGGGGRHATSGGS